jgi:hypothetical protein
MINSTGYVTTIAGTEYGFDGLSITQAKFMSPKAFSDE